MPRSARAGKSGRTRYPREQYVLDASKGRRRLRTHRGTKAGQLPPARLEPDSKTLKPREHRVRPQEPDYKKGRGRDTKPKTP